MTIDTEIAEWPPTLLDDMRFAVGRLESHDAHCSLEAAVLLNAAWDILLMPHDINHWDTIVGAISRLAELGQRHGEKLPADTVAFIIAVTEARKRWGKERIISGDTVPGATTVEGGLAFLEQQLVERGPEELITIRSTDDARETFQLTLGEFIEHLRHVAETHGEEV